MRRVYVTKLTCAQTSVLAIEAVQKYVVCLRNGRKAAVAT